LVCASITVIHRSRQSIAKRHTAHRPAQTGHRGWERGERAMIVTGLIQIQCLSALSWPTCLNEIAEPAPPQASAPERKPEQPAVPDLKLTVASADLWSRQVRSRYFDGFHLGDPVWGILLDVYVAEARGQRSSVSSLSFAASVPRSTGLRWVNVLVEEGKLIREPDRQDRRRHWVRLSEKARSALDSYFDELIRSSRHRLYIRSMHASVDIQLGAKSNRPNVGLHSLA
jgi:DNA-binding MarR family transcriptional regulator